MEARLADLLNQFYGHTERDIEGFEQAVGEFQERIPHLAQGLLAKIREEADEIASEIDAGGHKVAGEIGDLLFAVVNLARHLEVDPESALRATNLKFERRFAAIEVTLAASGKTPSEATLAEMDALWDQAKAKEKSGEIS